MEEWVLDGSRGSGSALKLETTRSASGFDRGRELQSPRALTGSPQRMELRVPGRKQRWEGQASHILFYFV